MYSRNVSGIISSAFFFEKKKNDEQPTARQHDVRISYPVRVNK